MGFFNSIRSFQRKQDRNIAIRIYNEEIQPTLLKDGYNHVLFINKYPRPLRSNRLINSNLTNWINFIMTRMRKSGFIILNIQTTSGPYDYYTGNSGQLITIITYQYAPQQYR